MNIVQYMKAKNWLDNYNKHLKVWLERVFFNITQL